MKRLKKCTVIVLLLPCFIEATLTGLACSFFGECCATDQPPTPSPPTLSIDDTKLVPPNSEGPIVAVVTGYSWRSHQSWPSENFERPIYNVLDAKRPEFWTYLLDELLLSRVDVIMLHGRGCWDAEPGSINSTRGTGGMCPRQLSMFVDAVQKAGVQDVVRVGMWDDTGMYRAARNRILGTNDIKFDLGDEDNWTFFWDFNIKIWFDTIPSQLWFRLDGRPVIANWNIRNNKFINQQGNASRLLSWLKLQFFGRYGVEPFFLLDRHWFLLDSTVNDTVAEGRHDWFNPLSSPYTFTEYNDKTWGVAIPGYRSKGTVPGCGNGCREVPRGDGATMTMGFEQGLLRSTDFILLEGWTDMVESAGFYRSQNWTYPNQYINIVRSYSDPQPETLLFQAEGADRFHDTTPEINLGGEYSSERALDVGKLPDDSGWYVGWTDAGEWIEYSNVQLGGGTYRFVVRAASTRKQSQVRIRLALPNMESVIVPEMGDETSYSLVHLGDIVLPTGTTTTMNLRIEFETGGVNMDWLFVKRLLPSNIDFRILTPPGVITTVLCGILGGVDRVLFA